MHFLTLFIIVKRVNCPIKSGTGTRGTTVFWQLKHSLPFYFHGVTPSDVAVMSPFSLLLWRPLSLSDVAFLRARAKITRVMFAFVFPF